MKLFDVVDANGRVVLSGCEQQMADDFAARRLVPMFVVPHALGLCPNCSHEIIEGPAGGVVCDECGWHCRPSRVVKLSPLRA
jgi:hypothetical protein